MANYKVTAAQVAAHAGVSKAAVSRVFNPGRSVSPMLADKVTRAAEELGYSPNLLARSLSLGRTRMIGLIVPYLYNQYYAEVLEQISLAFQAENYRVLVFVLPKTASAIESVVEDLLRYRVDGLIVASVVMSSQLAERCTEAGVPILLFNRVEDHGTFPSVTSDNLRGGRLAARHLLSLGHRRIGYIAGWEDASTQRDRESGFREELGKQGIELAARGVGNFMREDAEKSALAMFDTPDRPSAVFVANDFMAFAAMDVLRHKLGLRVPGDVSVIGFGDIAMSAWPSYDLSTVRQATGKMVSRAVSMLLEMIEEQTEVTTSIVVPNTLVARSSTGPFEKADT
ncbi:LacI family DNA-binding transcriptional regulator [Devosia aurantiaca]|uniref:Substrate-binding domain-containing protein n=1 Tax=Devosia aurantiaca TaxID=2714858 RepID=A0A6M1SH44_9HYPH|nr:LacI family DNA-binding transcriptional regulator [Devosia aurantiaca]NGP18777.1 substrate-binding domain-containing protein [Devosia aurantiaca]